MNDYLYHYAWGNNPIRAKYKGKPCRVVARGGMNSCVVEFEDGARLVTSRNALRKRMEGNDEQIRE